MEAATKGNRGGVGGGDSIASEKSDLKNGEDSRACRFSKTKGENLHKFYRFVDFYVFNDGLFF